MNVAAKKIRGLLLCLGFFAATPITLGWGDASAQMVEPERLPMFGQPDAIRPDHLKKADQDFIRDATLKHRSREGASRAFAAEGWGRFREGKVDLSLQSFNRAWLLQPNNYQAFWGFGAVLGDRGELLKAIEMLEKARQLIDDLIRSRLHGALEDRGEMAAVVAETVEGARVVKTHGAEAYERRRFTESAAVLRRNGPGAARDRAREPAQ